MFHTQSWGHVSQCNIVRRKREWEHWQFSVSGPKDNISKYSLSYVQIMKTGFGFLLFLSLKYSWKLLFHRCSWEHSQSDHPFWSIGPNCLSTHWLNFKPNQQSKNKARFNRQLFKTPLKDPEKVVPPRCFPLFKDSVELLQSWLLGLTDKKKS